ncbi:hypothetical protein [Paraburkholderia xenovorans]|uniref:hypothetical protein n=1 Tax=Paraburkholderia xenovorans TaxID=36873 RepID=UPI0015C52ADA|nr:hypothetical protein [Paraburkholderia xenovorans]
MSQLASSGAFNLANARRFFPSRCHATCGEDRLARLRRMARRLLYMLAPPHAVQRNNTLQDVPMN